MWKSLVSIAWFTCYLAVFARYIKGMISLIGVSFIWRIIISVIYYYVHHHQYNILICSSSSSV